MNKLSIKKDQVLIDHIDVGKNRQQSEITVEKGVTLTYLRFQNIESSDIICTDEKIFRLKDDAKLTFVSLSFGAKQENLSVEARIEGKNADCSFEIGYYAGNSQEFTYTLTENFLDSDSRGTMRIKGIGDGQSRTKVDGIIKIAPNAHRTNSHLEEHTLLLSRKARVQNIPGLEICTNDVRASHASTTSRIDSEQLFYMNARGIDRNTARSMIVQGFLNDIIESLTHQEFKKSTLQALIHKTTAGIS